MEVPVSPELARGRFCLAVGRIDSAGQNGAARRIRLQPARISSRYANHGEEFCAINDVGVALRRPQADGAIRKGMVGVRMCITENGTRHIFS